MAKKKVLSESPFVPVEEQPYPIPENWCWTRLKTLVETSKEKTDNFSDGDIKYVGLEHIEKDGGIIGYSSATKVKSLKAIFHVGQILYGKLRPYLNKHDIAIFEGVCSTDILVFNARNCTNSRYVNYFLDQRHFIEYAVSNSKGINLPRVSEFVILEAVCPLPPLAEQHRIVSRIESLFAKLDEAKEKAQAAMNGFELRKSAILHQAFTGELTKQWRKEYGVKLESWEKQKLKDVATWGSGGTPSRNNPEYYTGNIPWVKTGELTNSYLYETEEHISSEALSHSSAKIYPKETVLIAMYGATIGKCAILGIEAATNQACACAVSQANVYNMFLFYFLLSQKDNFIRLGKGGAQPNISQSVLKQYPIVLPSFPEQFEIVRIIDSLLTQEQQAKEAAQAILTQIDTMKKAILARAFRGELGTNDPVEEWAGELVKAML